MSGMGDSQNMMIAGTDEVVWEAPAFWCFGAQDSPFPTMYEGRYKSNASFFFSQKL